MKTHKKVSVIPIYLVGLTWLLYALLFPLYAPFHYILCAGASLLVFIIGKAIFPDKVYQTREDQEKAAQEKAKEQEKAEAQQKKAEEEALSKDPQVAALQKERARAISEMRRLNDAILDEKISAQIDHLEEVTGKILDQVIQQPKKQPQIRRFLDYYLPTTLKLLNAYDRMDSVGVSGSNIDATKEKVEKMLDTVCQAFDKQLDALFGEEALDISTDITVMENLLAQEGLTGMDINQSKTGREGINLEL